MAEIYGSTHRWNVRTSPRRKGYASRLTTSNSHFEAHYKSLESEVIEWGFTSPTGEVIVPLQQVRKEDIPAILRWAVAQCEAV